MKGDYWFLLSLSIRDCLLRVLWLRLPKGTPPFVGFPFSPEFFDLKLLQTHLRNPMVASFAGAVPKQAVSLLVALGNQQTGAITLKTNNISGETNPRGGGWSV